MRISVCVVAGLLGFSGRLGAQRPLGNEWFRVLAGQSVYANMDSITRIGTDTYRVVIIDDTFPGLRDIYTDEVKCAEHVARTIRQRSIGKRVLQDRSEAEAAFTKIAPGSAAEAKYQKVCAKGQRKYASAK